MARYFVAQDGTFIGAFDGKDVVVPPNGIEVLSAPDDARQKWQNGAWQPYVPDFSAIDTAVLNAALVEPGSVVRALGLVMFQEINKLRVKAGLAAYTMDQFVAALKANIR